MAEKKGMKQYPRELKLAAVRMFLEAGLPQKEIIPTFGVNDVG